MHRILIPLLLALIVMPGTVQASTLTDVSSIDIADRMLSEAMRPPPADAAWEQVELIGATRVGTRDGDQRTWYRFDIGQPADTDLQRYSLYFWRYNMSITVFMNGQELGGDRFRPGFQTLAWNHPQLIEIPGSSWQEGVNTFHVRFNPSPFGGTFAPIKFGPHATLQPIWEGSQFWRAQINAYLLVFAVLASITTLLLFLYRRQDTVYLWFFGVTVCWSVLLTHFSIYFNPIPYEYWLPLVHMAVDSWILCLFGFVNRLLDFRSTKIEKAMLAIWVLAICSHAFSPREYFWFLSYCFHLVLTLGILFLLALVLRKAVLERDRLAIAVVTAVLIHIGMSFHDYWLFFSASQQAWETASQKSQFGVPLILAVFLVSLLQRFKSALDESERLNEELEARVAATKAALEESYVKQRDLDQRRAAAEERQKIYRDLHDDVGSKLLTIMHDDGAGRVGGLASSALESLREAVYRANYRDEPFLEFLTTMREETKLRATGQGFACEWFEDPDLPNEVVPSKYAYHLARILREVVTNALHHSNGNELAVSIEVLDGDADQICVDVVDNGIGGTVPENGRSSGVRNIRQRAEAIDARVAWQAGDDGGMCFRLVMSSPVSRSVPAS